MRKSKRRRLANVPERKQTHQSNIHSNPHPPHPAGPRELSITRAEAIAPLAACRKSTLYALSHWNDDRLGLIETRSIRDHRLRRKPWDTALNSKALAKYDPSLQSTIGLFLDAIATAGEAGQKPINVTDWVAYLAYDLMGMIGFGRDFGQLRGGGVEHWAVKALRAQQLFIGVLKPIPWLLNFLAAIPGADGPVQPFVKYCAGLVAEKREVRPPFHFFFFCSGVGETGDGEAALLSLQR